MKSKQALKHMQNISDRLSIIVDDKKQTSIYWDNNKLTTLLDINALKDQEHGDCLLIASGPSVKDLKPDKVAHSAIFMMNGSIILADQFVQNKIYYVADDNDYIQRNMILISMAIQRADILFFTPAGISYICTHDSSLLHNKNLIMIERVNRFFNIPKLKEKLFYKKNESDPDYYFSPIGWFTKNYHIGFSKNLSKGYFSARTIPYCALQIAYHLGFRNISMIGVDFTNIGEHFYFEKKTEKTSLAKDYKRHILPSFKTAKQCAQHDGWKFKILNPLSRLIQDGL
jgi:KDO transferase-3